MRHWPLRRTSHTPACQLCSDHYWRLYHHTGSEKLLKKYLLDVRDWENLSRIRRNRVALAMSSAPCTLKLIQVWPVGICLYATQGGSQNPQVASLSFPKNFLSSLWQNFFLQDYWLLSSSSTNKQQIAPYQQHAPCSFTWHKVGQACLCHGKIASRPWLTDYSPPSPLLYIVYMYIFHFVYIYAVMNS
jgi:hypothetical protein